MMTLWVHQTPNKTLPTKKIQKTASQIVIQINNKNHLLTVFNLIKIKYQTMSVIWLVLIINKIQLVQMMKRSMNKFHQSKVETKNQIIWQKINSNPVYWMEKLILQKKIRNYKLLKNNQNKLRNKQNLMKLLKNQQGRICRKNLSNFKSNNRK
jgi:dephospho-CoA kinase